MKNFDLFFGCFGNGITVANRAVMEHGDYKNIAHISDSGKIKWYIDPTKAPQDTVSKIESMASTEKQKFDSWLSSLPIYTQYSYLLDRSPTKTLINVMDMDGDIHIKIEYLRKEIL